MNDDRLEVSTRQATLDDADAIRDLITESDALHAQELPALFRVPEQPRFSRDDIADILANDEAEIFVAEHLGTVVGFIYLEIEWATSSHRMPTRSCWVSNIVVRQAARRQGIGRRLMDVAEAWAHRKDLLQIKFFVWEFNRGAVAFYEQLGYTTLKREMWRSRE